MNKIMIKRLFFWILLILFSEWSADDNEKDEDDTPVLIPPKIAQPAIIRQVETRSLSESVYSLVNKYKINPDNISIYIRDINADKPLLSHNADVQRNPASTMKLLTTFAALKELGPSFTWRTEAWARGTLKDGVLDGDLIIKGYGDPFLIHERYCKFIYNLYAKGLKTIKGNIIIDKPYYRTSFTSMLDAKIVNC